METAAVREFNAIKDDILSRLNEWNEDKQVYLSDIGFELTLDENNTGAWIIGHYASLRYMVANAGLIGDIVESMDEEIRPGCDPFVEPEK